MCIYIYMYIHIYNYMSDMKLYGLCSSVPFHGTPKITIYCISINSHELWLSPNTIVILYNPTFDHGKYGFDKHYINISADGFVWK